MVAATAPSRWLLCWEFRGGENPFIYIYLFIYLNFLKYNINIRLCAALQPVRRGRGGDWARSRLQLHAGSRAPARGARRPEDFRNTTCPRSRWHPEDVFFLLQHNFKYISTYINGDPGTARERTAGERSRAAKQRPAGPGALQPTFPGNCAGTGASSAAKPAPGPPAPARPPSPLREPDWALEAAAAPPAA